MIGITHHAQSELGEIVHVDLPETGQGFSKGEALCCVESVKTAADVVVMVDGEVLEVNENLEADCTVVNADAEGEGWLLKCKLHDKE